MDAPQQRLGDAIVFRPAVEEGGCHRYLELADTSSINVSASYEGPGSSPTDVCGVAETAVAAVATSLAENGIGRRPVPSGQLWSTDACALLVPGDLGYLTERGRTDPYRSFGSWQCQWSDDGDEGRKVTVIFDRLAPPSQTGRPVPGTPAFVDPAEPGRCNAEIPKRPYVGSGGTDLAEVLRLRVEGPDPDTVLCDEAARLAVAANRRI